MSYEAHEAYVTRKLRRDRERLSKVEAQRKRVHYDCFGCPHRSKGDADYISSMVDLTRRKGYGSPPLKRG